MQLKRLLTLGIVLLMSVCSFDNVWGENADSASKKAKPKKQAKNPNYKKVILDQLSKSPSDHLKYNFSIKDDCMLYGEVKNMQPTGRDSNFKLNLKEVTSYELHYTDYSKFRYYWINVDCNSNCSNESWNTDNGVNSAGYSYKQLQLTEDYNQAKLALVGLQKLTKTCGGKGATISDRSSEDKGNVKLSSGSGSKSNSGEYSVSGKGSWTSDHRMYITPITCSSGETHGIVKHAEESYGPNYGISGGNSGYKSFEEAARQACGGN